MTVLLEYLSASVCCNRYCRWALYLINGFINPHKFTNLKAIVNLRTELFGLVRMHCINNFSLSYTIIPSFISTGLDPYFINMPYHFVLFSPCVHCIQISNVDIYVLLHIYTHMLPTYTTHLTAVLLVNPAGACLTGKGIGTKYLNLALYLSASLFNKCMYYIHTQCVLKSIFLTIAMSELLFECYSAPSVAYGVDALFSFHYNQANSKCCIQPI